MSNQAASDFFIAAYSPEAAAAVATADDIFTGLEESSLVLSAEDSLDIIAAIAAGRNI